MFAIPMTPLAYIASARSVNAVRIGSARLEPAGLSAFPSPSRGPDAAGFARVCTAQALRNTLRGSGVSPRRTRTTFSAVKRHSVR